MTILPHLFLRAIILRQQGYDVVTTAEHCGGGCRRISSGSTSPCSTTISAPASLGQMLLSFFATSRPEVPIIILSATLEYHFGGVGGHASAERLQLERRPDRRSEIARGQAPRRACRCRRPGVLLLPDRPGDRSSDVLIQVLDAEGTVDLLQRHSRRISRARSRTWFPGRNLFIEMPDAYPRLARCDRRCCGSTRQTYIDRSRRGLLAAPPASEPTEAWSVIAFPMTLHDGRSGVVLTARILGRTSAA